jgi:hypothetical protein
VFTKFSKPFLDVRQRHMRALFISDCENEVIALFQDCGWSGASTCMPAWLSATYLLVQADARIARRLTLALDTHQALAPQPHGLNMEADDGRAEYPDSP